MEEDNKSKKDEDAELKAEAERLARLLYSIYKEDYPKIKHRMEQKA